MRVAFLSVTHLWFVCFNEYLSGLLKMLSETLVCVKWSLKLSGVNCTEMN